MNQDASQNAPGAPAPAQVSAPPPDPSASAPARRVNSPGNAPGGAPPYAPPTSTAPPANGGLKSALKIAAPLAALVGVVFGVTFLNQNVPKDPDEVTKKTGGEDSESTEPPLRFFSSTRALDLPKHTEKYRDLPMLAPSAANTDGDPEQAWAPGIQNRLFQGVYEQDIQTARNVQFWFENRNPNSVTLQLQRVSCSACSQGTLIEIPPETTRNLLQHTALAALPLGPFNAYGIGLTQPLAELQQLPRAPQKFRDNPNAQYHVRAATSADKWAPQWGILELGFEVRGSPGEAQKPLEALFTAQVDGTQRISTPKFDVKFDVAAPCEVWRPTIDLGRLDQLSTDREYDVLVFSSTRGPGSEFGDLTLSKNDIAALGPGGMIDPVGFVEIRKVERIPEADLAEVGGLLAADRKFLARLRSAYRVSVLVHPKVGDKQMEIGAIDRTIAVTVGGGVKEVRLKGQVRGAVWLDEDRDDIELSAFKGGDGTRQEVNLIAEKAGIEVAVVKSECKPAYYTYELVKQPDRERNYKLIVTVKPGRQFGRVRGEVVLEVKGPAPQRIRIPVRSSAGL